MLTGKRRKTHFQLDFPFNIVVINNDLEKHKTCKQIQSVLKSLSSCFSFMQMQSTLTSFKAINLFRSLDNGVIRSPRRQNNFVIFYSFFVHSYFALRTFGFTKQAYLYGFPREDVNKCLHSFVPSSGGRKHFVSVKFCEQPS